MRNYLKPIPGAFTCVKEDLSARTDNSIPGLSERVVETGHMPVEAHKATNETERITFQNYFFVL